MQESHDEITTRLDMAVLIGNKSTSEIELSEPELSRQADSSSREKARATTESPVEFSRPATSRLITIVFALILSILLVGLDSTVIGTIIPTVSRDFDGADEIGWYGSAYFLSACSCQTMFGKLHEMFSLKRTFISAIFIFEVGSLMSGIAPNSIVFIAGRAVAGIGFAGIVSGGLNILVRIVPLAQRSIYNGILGAFEMLAQAIGPVFGGAVATKWSWRWCFYLNIPAGAIVMLLIASFCRFENEKKKKTKPIRETLTQIDIVGCSLFIPAVVCLMLALQWGGNVYPWDNFSIVLCLAMSFALILAFILVEIRKGELAMLPPRAFRERTVLFAAVFGFCIASALSILDVYLPIWFQKAKGVSALDSGTMLLPLIISLLLGSLIVGPAVSFIGYYHPFMFAGCAMMSVGSGLLTTLHPTTDPAKWIGYQVLLGLGAGLSYQQPFNAVQATLAPEHTSVGISSVLFSQTLGSTLFISVAQSVFLRNYQQATTGTPANGGFGNPASNTTGSTLNTSTIQPAQIAAYSDSLTRTFLLPLGLSVSLVIGALGVRWTSVRANDATITPRG